MIPFTKGTELTIFGQLNSNEVLNKFKSKNFKASKLSTYDFSTKYSQTCVKQAPMGKPKIGCLNRCLLNTGRF